MQKMNNRGQVTVILTVLLIAVVLVGGFFVVKNVIIDDGKTTVGSCPDSTSVLTVNDRSALPTGTDPGSPTITCGTQDSGVVTTSVTSGTTTFPVGEELVCFLTIGDYIDAKYDVDSICGGTTLDAPMFYSTSDNPALTWYNDDDNAMSDDSAGGSGTNQTDLSAGETFTVELKIQGTSGESSGDGIIVVEFPASTSANITSATLGGKSPVSIPSVHALQNAGSKAFAFEIDAVEGGTVERLALQVQLTASKDLAGGVLTDWYAKQWFIDDDDTLAYGVEDSDGTLKYENTFDSDWFID